MQRYNDNILARSGGYVIPAAGASVTVKDYPAGTVATIYSDDGVTPKTNPVVTGSEGEFFFYAADGRYSLEISGGGYTGGNVVDITLDGLGDTDVDTLRTDLLDADGVLLVGNAADKRDLASTASGEGAALVGYALGSVEDKLGETRSTNDSPTFEDAIADTPIGGTLIIKGAVPVTAPLVITKRINLICPGADDYLEIAVGAGSNALTFKGNAAGINNIYIDINVYGAANCCLNAVTFERVDRSNKLRVNARAGAAAYGVRYLGCLINQIEIEQSVNYLPPLAAAAMPLDHVFIGRDTQGFNVWTNANKFWVNLEGARHGIVSEDMNSQGNNAIAGTIEGLSGRPLNLLNAYGAAIGSGGILHLEANAQNALLTNCKSSSVRNVGNTTGGLDLVGCRAVEIDGYSGSLSIDSTSVGTKLGALYTQASHTFVDLSLSTESIGGSAAQAGGALIMSGLAGRATLENIYHNPYLDIWSAGAASAPDGVTLSACTVAQDAVVYFPGNPGKKSAVFTVSGTAITSGPNFVPKAPWSQKLDERFVSVMIPIYVATGQPNVRVYVLAGGQYNFLRDVTERDQWVVVRGSVRAGSMNDTYVAPRCYDGAAFVAGEFRVGGCALVEGPTAPKTLCDHGKRAEHIVTSVANTPAFVGQRAFASGKWYMAAGVASSADWGEVPSLLPGVNSYNPPSIAAGGVTTTTIAVTNAAMGDFVVCSFSVALDGVIVTGWVSSAGTVTIQFHNPTAGAIDLGTGTLRVRVFKG